MRCTIRVMPSYAVTWCDDLRRPYVGKLELGREGLTLDGTADDGTSVSERVDYADCDIQRSRERLHGRRAVRLDRAGSHLLIASMDLPGTAYELAEQLAARASAWRAPAGAPRFLPHGRLNR